MKTFFAPAIIVGAALFLFVWKLDSVPSGIYVDEAVEAYDAFSLLKTGKDQFGQTLPILFRLFGSYTPGMYMYMLVPAVAMLGFDAWAIRLPSAVFGALNVATVWAIALRWTGNRNWANWGALWFGILPWVVKHSRQGYEVMLAVMLYNLGWYFFVTGLRDKRNIKWGSLMLVLASYAGAAQRYQMIFVVVGFGILLVRKWGWGAVRSAFLVFVVANFFNLILIGTNGFWIKNSVFDNVPWQQTVNNALGLVGTLANLGSWFNYVPDVDKQHLIPGLAIAYWWMFVPVLWGVWIIRRNPLSIFVWTGMFGVGVLPAVMAGVFLSEQRMLGAMLPLGIAMTVGYGDLVKRLAFRKGLVVGGMLLVYSLLLLWRGYFVLLPSLNSQAWNAEYKELFEFLYPYRDREIVVDNARSDRNFIFQLYYWKMNPRLVQEILGRKTGWGYYEGWKRESDIQIHNISYRPVDWGKDTKGGKLVVADRMAISDVQRDHHKLVLVKSIPDGKGEVVLNVFRTSDW